MASNSAAPSSWLYGPSRDLLIGCGLWYVVLLAVFAVFGAEFRDVGLKLAPFLALLLGTPHYGATLLRVYQHREDRRAYFFFAVHLTLLLVAIFAIGVHNGLVGSIILTVYLTWSAWHYTGQNYGLAVMFLRRREVPLTQGVKRALYASFLLSYAMTFLALHGGGPADNYAPLDFASVSYRFLPLGIPESFSRLAFAGLASTYALAVAVAAGGLLRRARARELVPVAALVLTQALWFSIPVALRHWGMAAEIEPWAPQFGRYYFLWVALAHSVQYLWVTSYYAKTSPRWTGEVPYLMKVMLAGSVVWILPALVFAPGAFGRLPYDGGLAVLVASVVNIHHFILDGAIWKLRDGRVARILLRRRDTPADTAFTPGLAERWLGWAVWATGAACVALMFAAEWETEFRLRPALSSEDPIDVARSADRLTWMGRDSPKVRLALGRALIDQGQLVRAQGELARSIELRPTAEAWFVLGGLYGQQQQWPAAVEAYESALVLWPDADVIYFELGKIWLKTGEPERARDAFARGAALRPERQIHREMLERAERAIP